MNEQMGLWDGQDRKVDLPFYEAGMNTDEKFAIFHEANPHIYDLLVEKCFRLLRKGRKHYGIKALIEVIRFDYAVTTTGDLWKINNNYAPLYSRKIMGDHIALDGFFELRKRKNEREL